MVVQKVIRVVHEWKSKDGTDFRLVELEVDPNARQIIC